MLAGGSFGFPSAGGAGGWGGDDSPPSKDENEEMEDGQGGLPNTGAKPKRKRPKFIRKIECLVCGDTANDHNHYGSHACYSCRAFFRRGVHANTSYYCSRERNCQVNKQTRKHCQFCRFQKCLSVGMKPTWVMTEEDKQAKREKAIARRMTLEAKKAGKSHKKTGGASAAPRLVEIKEHEPKYDFGMRPPLPAASSPKHEMPSPKQEPPSPSVYYIKEEPMSPGGLPFNSMSLSEIRQPMTHESGYSSSGRSPGNVLEDRPSSPEDDDHHIANEHLSGAVATGGTASEDLEMIENADLGRDIVPVYQPVMPYSIEEKQLVDNLINIELGTAEMIPVPINLLQSLIEAARTRTVVPYQTTLEGYTICMKRIIRYASQLDFFQSFSGVDQRNLLLANTDMLVNIKSARMLKPGVNLKDQLVFAVGDAEMAARQVLPFTALSTAPPNKPLEYGQIYQSPWASSSKDETKFMNMMKNIFDLEMDRTTTTLMGMMALFSVSYTDLTERDRAMQNQEFFTQLLYRYLCSEIGKKNAVKLLPKYMYLLSELEEMAQIMVTKRLLL